MTAGEHRIIIEKGGDFQISVQVTEGIGVPMDLTDYTVTMRIRAAKDYEKVNEVSRGAGDYVQINTSNTVTLGPVVSGTNMHKIAGELVNAAEGKIKVQIDQAITAQMKTLVDTTDHEAGLFDTEYNYYYTIDINKTVGSEDIRILRGRCAVRE